MFKRTLIYLVITINFEYTYKSTKCTNTAIQLYRCLTVTVLSFSYFSGTQEWVRRLSGETFSRWFGQNDPNAREKGTYPGKIGRFQEFHRRSYYIL